MKNLTNIMLLLLLVYGCAFDYTPKRVLILGNSITHHGPLVKENWFGDWGMAATSQENDYVHILMAAFPEMHFEHKNIAYWEADFKYDFKDEPLTKYNPDLLIIRLGENVRTLEGYKEALNGLITTFNGKKVILTGNFWHDAKKDSIQRSVALEGGHTFVEFNTLWDKKYQAIDEYEPGSGVGLHPNNKGMAEIARLIKEKI